METVQTGGVYMDPFIDFSFKRLFGTEANKDVLVAFLNALFKEEEKIRSVTFLNTEQLGYRSESRKVVFDLFCETDKGEKIIIELQNVSQRWFKHRSLFYSAMGIAEQEIKGGWNYYLNPVYVICLMNFCFEGTRPDAVVHEVGLIDKATKEVFNDRLHFIYVEIPKFNKQEKDIREPADCWFYIFKNMASLNKMPVFLQHEPIYRKVFEIARFNQLNPTEMDIYDVKLKETRDRANTLAYAWETGLEKGIKEGIKEGIEKGIERGIEKGNRQGMHQARIEVARLMKQANEPLERIVLYTCLSAEEINLL